MKQTWERYLQPASLPEASALLNEYQDQARVIAGGSDVIVELSRGVRPTSTLIDITRLSELSGVVDDGDTLRFGGLVTHNDVIASAACVDRALPLAQACWEIGAPQLRTRATVAGNLVTASPANDTISALIALDASLILVSTQGERVVPLSHFYTGFRTTVLRPNELIREIRIPALRPNQRGIFLKLGLRRAQAISVIHLAMVLTFDKDIISDARIALGCLAPTIVRSASAERTLIGQTLSPAICQEAGRRACDDVSPIGDIRGSTEYRLQTLARLVTHGLERIANGTERDGWPDAPVLLDTGYMQTSRNTGAFNGTIETTINGVPHSLGGDAARKTLLDALREDAGLTGSKEGCAEGECGACTVWIDGQAVMSCIVPAGQAHGASITTIEGLARSNGRGPDDGTLHPLQQAFIDQGAVQCGYCIPGMLMAGAKLLDERPHPSTDETLVALSGNICRCTGYRKILDAVKGASHATTLATPDTSEAMR